MAGKTKTEPGGSNRVRFVMLEADLTDTNANAFAQAIVSALRSEAPAAPKRLAPVAAPVVRLPAPVPTNGDSADLDHDADDTEASTEASNGGAQPQAVESAERPRRPSRPPQPDYVNGLFASAADADEFKAFVAQHTANKHSERYLISALYLREHGTPVVNMDKIYTCYRTAGWPMTVSDWDVNLRNQTRNDRFRRVDGGYSITTNGESVVQGLRTS